MVAALDDFVGNVTASLKQHKLWENTLVIMHADNGGVQNSPQGLGRWHNAQGKGGIVGSGGSAYPLRSNKFNVWEGTWAAAAPACAAVPVPTGWLLTCPACYPACLRRDSHAGNPERRLAACRVRWHELRSADARERLACNACGRGRGAAGEEHLTNP